jgi:hypothetical protein
VTKLVRLPKEATAKGYPELVAGEFALAALFERRNSLIQKPAVIDHRYKKQSDPLPRNCHSDLVPHFQYTTGRFRVQRFLSLSGSATLRKPPSG